MSHPLDDCPCPWCERPLIGAEAADQSNDMPTPGAISVCIGCGLPSMFDDNLKLRLMTKDEMFEVWQDPGVRFVIEGWLNVTRMEEIHREHTGN